MGSSLKYGPFGGSVLEGCRTILGPKKVKGDVNLEKYPYRGFNSYLSYFLGAHYYNCIAKDPQKYSNYQGPYVTPYTLES